MLAHNSSNFQFVFDRRDFEYHLINIIIFIMFFDKINM